MPFTLSDFTPETKLSQLSLEDLCSLAEGIRVEIINAVACHGGHLASNLGDLELVLALHSVFDFPNDKLFFDTGHQCYAHKILTGRLEQFRNLREMGGCCGFPLPSESKYDHLVAGHSGTAISSALGYAAARDRVGGKEKIIVVEGDGALGCGSSLEGLNSIAVTTKDFLLILNDNKMSIAPNVGVISRFLSHVISARSYNLLKTCFSAMVNNFPLVGKRLKQMASRLENSIKSLLIHENMFGDLGLRYIGPVDGHDLGSLQVILRRIRSLKGPILLHVLTQKGHGYGPAVEQPSKFHGTSPFDIVSGEALCKSNNTTFSKVFGETLCKLRSRDSRICAITAGMPGGTGLDNFAAAYPDSFYDVGIAEGHGTAFAAGLAGAGQRPVFAVYASFSQRAFDYAFQDVCLNSLPVVFCLDRAGVVADGPTHHGIQDLAFWRVLPNITILQPSDGSELLQMLSMSLMQNTPTVIRYPGGSCSELMEKHKALEWGRAEIIRNGSTPIAIWSVGRELETALKILPILTQQGIDPTIVNTRFVFPFDKKLMTEQICAGMKIVIIENHLKEGGFASIVCDELSELKPTVLRFGWPNGMTDWGNVEEQRKKHGLDATSIAWAICR